MGTLFQNLHLLLEFLDVGILIFNQGSKGGHFIVLILSIDEVYFTSERLVELGQGIELLCEFIMAEL